MPQEMAELGVVVASSVQEATAANDPPPTADHIPPLNGPATADRELPQHHIQLPHGPVGADESFHPADDTQPAPSLHPLSEEAKDQEVLKRAFKVALLICAISAAAITSSPESERKHKGLSDAYLISILITFIVACLLLVISLFSWELHIPTSVVRFLMWVALGLLPAPIFLGAFLAIHN